MKCTRVFTPLTALSLALAACAPGASEPVPLEPSSQESSITVLPEAEPSVEEQLDALVAGTEVAATAQAPAQAAPEAETAEGEAEEDASTPEGTIAISADNETFVTGEENPVTVVAGNPFYLQLDFSDPEGVSALTVELRNSEFAGPLPTGPFSILDDSDCQTQLASAPTEIVCTMTVATSPDAQPIAEEGESAYAFRPTAGDLLGNTVSVFSWAYLVIETP